MIYHVGECGLQRRFPVICTNLSFINPPHSGARPSTTNAVHAPFTSLSPHFCFGQYFIQRMDAREPAIVRFLATNNPILGSCTYQVPSCHAQFILYQIWGPVGISYFDFYAEYAHCVYLNINQICAYCIQIGKYPNTLCVFFSNFHTSCFCELCA